MITATNNTTDNTTLFSDPPEEEFFLVLNMETTENFCPIMIFVNKEDRLIHIQLDHLTATDIESEIQAGSLRENSLSNLLELIKSRRIRKMKIISDNFNYDNNPSLAFLLNLLLNIEKMEEFEFLVTDEREILVHSLPVLMFAALRNSREMRRINLKFSYYDFPREDLTNILKTALSGAPKLEELTLEMLGKTIPFARIFNGLMNGRSEWTNSLQRLIINCLNFNRKATFLKVFNYFPNLKHLSLIAEKININDEILLRTTIQNFRTLNLSLRNPNITNEAVSQFLNRDFENFTELKLDFARSSIDDGAFDRIIYYGMRNFNPAINLEFDIENTKATKKCCRTVEYFLERRLKGPDDNGEASVKVLRKNYD